MEPPYRVESITRALGCQPNSGRGMRSNLNYYKLGFVLQSRGYGVESVRLYRSTRGGKGVILSEKSPGVLHSLRELVWFLFTFTLYPVGLAASFFCLVYACIYSISVLQWPESFKSPPIGNFASGQLAVFALIVLSIGYLLVLLVPLFKFSSQEEGRKGFPQWWLILLVVVATTLYSYSIPLIFSMLGR